MPDSYDYVHMSKATLITHCRAMARGIHQVSQKAMHLVIENKTLKDRLKRIEENRRVFQEMK